MEGELEMGERERTSGQYKENDFVNKKIKML
jgi:hypothetical protein